MWGTLAVLEAAVAAGVRRVVNISSDKAADPFNVLGFSKRIGERLTALLRRAQRGRRVPECAVRQRAGFSRGSVLEVFRAQIDAGGPVTVTDPDVPATS